MTQDKDLIGLVLDFTGQINALELKYAPLAEQDGFSAVYPDFSREVARVYERFLTRRERRCCMGLSSPPRFAAIHQTAYSAVEQTKNRAVVTFCTVDGQLDVRFSLQYRDGAWRINSFQQRYHACGRAVQVQWQYGSF